MRILIVAPDDQEGSAIARTVESWGAGIEPLRARSVAEAGSAGAEIGVAVAVLLPLEDLVELCGAGSGPPVLAITNDAGDELRIREACRGVVEVLVADGAGRHHGLIEHRVASALRQQKAASLDQDALSALANRVPAMLGYWDAALRCRFANDAYRLWFGVSPSALIGRRIDELLGPLYARNLPYIEGALRGERQDFEREIPDPAGGPARRALASYIPDIKDGVVRGFCVLVTDVSELKRLEHSLRESEERWKTLFSILPVGVSIVGADGAVREVNPALEKILGLTVEDMACGVHRSRVYLRADGSRMSPAEYATELASRSGGVAHADIGVVKEDGATVWTSVVSAPLPAAPGACVTVTTDVTQRKADELALARAVARMHAVLNATVDGIITIGEGNRIELVNDAVTRIFGYAREELIGRALSMLMPEPVRSQHDSFIAAYEAGGVARVIGKGRDVVGRRKDGSEIHLHLSVAPLPSAADAGRYIGTLHDITARKAAEAERRMLEDHLRQSQKLQAIGRLAGGIAHDFNNLLTVINVTAEQIAAALHEDSPAQADLTELLGASERGSALTRQLLTFSHRGLLTRSTLDIVSVIERLIPILRRLMPANVTLSVEAQGIQQIEGDLAQIEQILMNLVLNARDAMPQGGRVVIRSRLIYVDEAMASSRPPLRPGTHVSLQVSDTGVGMTRATLDRIFEPFFTTKGPGQGSGLGLATVHGIVTAVGGTLEVKSAPGKGSTFAVWIPVAGAHATLHGVTSGSEKTILVVEDEAPILRVATRALSGGGYKVLGAENGEVALQMVANLAGRLDLLITDIVMPRMNGAELAQKIVAGHPETRVLFASGYGDDVVNTYGVPLGRAHYIAKPYSLASLRDKVRDVLAS